MKLYCSSCGHPNESTASSPAKFCSRCGNPLGAAFRTTQASQVEPVAQQKPVKKIVQPTLARHKQKYAIQEREEDSGDDNYDFEIAQPNLSDMQISIGSKVTVGSLQDYQTPISRGPNPMGQGIPNDIEVTSKNPFANLE